MLKTFVKFQLNILSSFRDVKRSGNFNPFPPIDVSAADIFWKHCDKRRNCSKQAISPFATIFSISLSNNTYNCKMFPYFWVDIFNVICCRFAVCGKGLINFLHDLKWGIISIIIFTLAVISLAEWWAVLLLIQTSILPSYERNPTLQSDIVNYSETLILFHIQQICSWQL